MAGIVLAYLSRLGTPMLTHEKVTLEAVARSIAQIKHYEFAGWHDTTSQYSGDIYFVPDDTLMPDEAASLGIRSPNDFFGGVVSHPFVKTKAITHQLVSGSADRPLGWSSVFADRVRDVVLPGYTVFSARDARVAAKRLTPHGTIRLKQALACGSRGQILIAAADQLDAFLDAYPSDELVAAGLVLESNLRDVITLSVGQIGIGDGVISYHGVQRLTNDNEGRSLYGGSDLVCVRGGWEALAELPMTKKVRVGVEQAITYEMAMEAYPGFMASRRNYDVGQGLDAQGKWRSGVFESSWRSGGASTAELAALTAFAQDPGLHVLNICSIKEYGNGHRPPPHATVHFRGNDPRDGPMIRYTVATPSIISGSLSHFGRALRHRRQAAEQELSPNVGDGRDQAAAV
jgi:hypothetical protein